MEMMIKGRRHQTYGVSVTRQGRLSRRRTGMHASHGGDPREKASTHLSKFLLRGRNQTQKEASAQRTLQGILRVGKISSGYPSTQRCY